MREAGQRSTENHANTRRTIDSLIFRIRPCWGGWYHSFEEMEVNLRIARVYQFFRTCGPTFGFEVGVPRPTYIEGGAFSSVPLCLASCNKKTALKERQGRALQVKSINCKLTYMTSIKTWSANKHQGLQRPGHPSARIFIPRVSCMVRLKLRVRAPGTRSQIAPS
jgi:hypothetical protein